MSAKMKRHITSLAQELSRFDHEVAVLLVGNRGRTVLVFLAFRAPAFARVVRAVRRLVVCGLCVALSGASVRLVAVFPLAPMSKWRAGGAVMGLRTSAGRRVLRTRVNHVSLKR